MRRLCFGRHYKPKTIDRMWRNDEVQDKCSSLHYISAKRLISFFCISTDCNLLMDLLDHIWFFKCQGVVEVLTPCVDMNIF